MSMAFGICVRDAEEAALVVEGLDALEVVCEDIGHIPRCRDADSRDSFITLLPRRGALHAVDLDLDFGELAAIAEDPAKMAQYRTCLERLDVPYTPPKLYPVLHIAPKFSAG